MKIEDITVELLINIDHENLVWLSWSWLSMIGMEGDVEKRQLYERIYDVKEKAEKMGYTFKADNPYLRMEG